MPSLAMRRQRAKEMRELPDNIRSASIAASDNVIGFGRFVHQEKQVSLSRAYHKPIKPEGAA